MQKIKLFLITTLLILVLSGILWGNGQASPAANSKIDWMVPLTAGGGGTAASASYRLSYTIGQTTIGTPASANYAMRMGFWQQFVDGISIWLPVIFK